MMTTRSVKVIAKANPAQVGDGFFIRRPMPSAGIGLGELSPFLLLDHAGPTVFAPAKVRRGVDVHPHRGFETVTIVYQGELEHRDSSGSAGKISVGDVQWMTAGSGVVHEEKHSQAFTESGGTLEMIQLWVNLPAKHKMTAPKYQEVLAHQIPSVALNGGESTARVIAGTFNGETGPAVTLSPMLMLDIRGKAGEKITLPIEDGYNAGLYLLSGAIRLADGQSVKEAEIAQFGLSGNLEFEVLAPAKILLLAGEPINEPIASYGPFVMNTAAEIQQAIADFHSGKMGVLA
jgi:redox-sensitive bicupin YhaK (pirin superfamily)